MRFTASVALIAAAVVPAALAQSVNIDPVTLTQCATSTITFEPFSDGSGPFYVAIIPANDPCTEDALAEFYDVESSPVSYYVNLAAGTPVQVYVLDVNGVETWGEIETVVDGGDSSCLGGDAAAVTTTDSATPDSSTYVPPTTSSSSSSVSIASAYVAPPAATTTHTTSSNTYQTPEDTTSSSDSDVAPVNAADNTSGATSLSASVTLLVGSFALVAALF